MPDSKVGAELGRGAEVVIKSGTGVVVWRGPQRSLYRKYGWPAKKDIQDHLILYKEEVLDE